MVKILLQIKTLIKQVLGEVLAGSPIGSKAVMTSSEISLSFQPLGMRCVARLRVSEWHAGFYYWIFTMPSNRFVAPLVKVDQ